MSNKMIMLGKETSMNVGGENYLFLSHSIGRFENYITPYMSVVKGTKDTQVLLITNKTSFKVNNHSVIEADYNEGNGDAINFPYAVTQITRKKPVTHIGNNSFTYDIPLVITNNTDERSYYVKLTNGDLYEMLVSYTPLDVDTYKKSNSNKNDKDDKNIIIVGTYKRMIAKRINKNVSVISESVVGKENTSFIGIETKDFAVKSGKKYSPVISPFIINNDWIGVTYYPSPYYATFLGFKKEDYKTALGNSSSSSIKMYLVAITDRGVISEDVSKYNKGIKKAFLYSDNNEYGFYVLSNDGHLYTADGEVLEASDLGVYWTNITSLNKGCIKNLYSNYQGEYLANGGYYSNFAAAADYCKGKTGNSWGGVGAKSGRFSPEYRTVKISHCDCKYYSDSINQFKKILQIGIPIYKDNDGNWHSLNNDYEIYFSDGSRALSQIKGMSSETVENLEFFYQNLQKNKLLISKSVTGEFFEECIVGYYPVRIDWIKKDTVKLPR